MPHAKGGASEIDAMRFVRWADENPDHARDVESIMRVWRVARRVACRWRKAHRESLKHPMPRLGRHDLRLDDLHQGKSEYVAASLSHARRGQQ